MKKAFVALTVVAALFAGTLSVSAKSVAKEKLDSLKSEIAAHVSQNWTSDGLKAKIADIEAKSAELIEKHKAVVEKYKSDPANSAKIAKMEEKTKLALEKHDALIKKLQELIKALAE